jgi:hypothetical protein
MHLFLIFSFIVFCLLLYIVGRDVHISWVFFGSICCMSVLKGLYYEYISCAQLLQQDAQIQYSVFGV